MKTRRVSAQRIELENFYNKYADFIESNDHVLFGYDTPVYLARLIHSISINSASIVYDGRRYVRRYKKSI